MNNNVKSQKWLFIMSVVDKIISIAAISYGFYLYYQSGVFNNGEFLFNPIYWIIGGTLSLVISLVNIPKLFLSKMKKSMVVNR